LSPLIFNDQFALLLRSPLSLCSPMTTNDGISPIAPLRFNITSDMTSSQATTEMYSKTASSSHSSKLIMQAMIMIAIAYENVCSAARAAAAAAGAAYVPPTLVEYDSMIDRPVHATYVLAAAVHGAVMPAPDPFNVRLAQAHVDILTALDVFVASKHWNQVFNVGGNAAQQFVQEALQQAQKERIDRGISAIMKECNFVLANALCASLNAPDMQSFQHLTNLSFVQEANNCETSFGQIPDQDLRHPHLQLFCRLTHEYFRVGRLRGTTGVNQFPFFNAPNISGGIDTYKKSIEPYFLNLRNYRFATSETTIDYMQATVRGAFLFNASQDPSTPEHLKKEYLVAFQAYCSELHDNQAHITNARMDNIEAAMRQRCAAAKIAMSFDSKLPYDKARLFKAPVTNSSFQGTRHPLPVTNHHKAVPREGLGKKGDVICLWCGKKGHILYDCTGPAPNYAAQMTRDELVAKRAR
jgi:hypothetical protein